MSVAEIKKFGFKKLGAFYINKNSFIIEVEDLELLEQEKTIYIHTIDNEILRVGSSKAKLKTRMKRFERDITKSLNKQKSCSPTWEGQKWRDRLGLKKGVIYARQGTLVTTPVGKFRTYLDEESFLIGKYHPPLNRSKHR